MATQSTPTRKVMPGLVQTPPPPLLETSILENKRGKIMKQSIIWGTVNLGMLSIILYDLTYACPIYVSYVQYAEYVCVVIFTLNLLYHFTRYVRVSIVPKQSTPPTWQRKNNDTSKQGSPTVSMLGGSNTPRSPSLTPMNLSATSWMTSGQSYSPSWPRNSPQTQAQQPQSPPVLQASRRDTSGVDFITDESSLNVYLKDFETNEKITGLDGTVEHTTNALSSFWNHPMAKTAKDVSAFLKRCQYQLSSPVANLSFNSFRVLSSRDLPNYYYGKFPRPFHLFGSTSNSPKSDDKASPIGGQSPGMDTWRRLNVDSVALTQWNANLRMWISQTILSRLVKEFEVIDDALQKQGLLDIQIGKVGLERLRKTAQTAPVLQFMPTLPTTLPFLELTPNQEYLVSRIRQLAKGGCMSVFKWNSGSSYNGKEWDQSLPTDSSIIMHLLASYLDTQLMPLPNQPDTKPFTGFHFIKFNEKPPQLTSATLAIQQVVEYPPHYRVIIGEEIFELIKGYNNLFHSVLLFLYYVNKREHGMLGRVNLGRSGVNMLWIIQS